MSKKKSAIVWRVSQPPQNEEIVIFVNHVKISYHFVKWVGENDWEIKLGHGVYVGPRNFEGGYQFVPDIKDKEFFWVPREDFIKSTKNKAKP